MKAKIDLRIEIQEKIRKIDIEELLFLIKTFNQILTSKLLTKLIDKRF